MERPGMESGVDPRAAGATGEDGDWPRGGRALAAVVVAGLACLLALLPVAIAVRALALPPGWVVPAASALGAAVLAVKSAAIAWGLAVRAWNALKGGAAVASVD